MIFSKDIKKEMNATYYTNVYNAVMANTKLMDYKPNIISRQLITQIIDMHTKGHRIKYIAKDLKNLYLNIDLEDLTFIVESIVSISTTSFEKKRAKEAGTEWYIWRTSEDAKVRKSHRIMEGVIVNWDDLISPEELVGEVNVGYYHAGEIPGCRCYAEPILEVDWVKKWPRKVYYNSKIQRMTQKQFIKIICK